MRIFYMVFILGICINLYPKELLCQEETLILNSLTVSNNLTSQRFNDKVFRDSEGTVWISSIEGLNRYEGGTVYQTLSDPSLTNKRTLAEPNILSNFFEDEKGDIWFNTSSFLHRFNRLDGTFLKYSLENSPLGTGKHIELVYLDSTKHQLWFASESTLFITSSDSPSFPLLQHKIPAASGFGSKMGILNSSDQKYLFVPTGNGCQLFIIPPTNSLKDWRRDSLSMGIQSHTFLPISESQALIGTDSGIVHFHIQQSLQQPIYEYEDKSLGKIMGIHPYEGDLYLLLSSMATIFIYDASSKQIINQASIFLSQNYGAIPSKFRQSYLDRDKTLWISSESQGIFFANLYKRKFSNFLKKPPASTGLLNDIISLTTTSEGNIWCLTSKGIQVISSDGETLTQWEDRLEELKKVYGDYPYYLYSDKIDLIWICSSMGLFSFDPKTGFFSTLTKDFENLHPTYLIQREDGELLVSSLSGIWRVSDKGALLQVQSIFPEKHPDRSQAFGYMQEWKKGKLVVNRPYKGLTIYAVKSGAYQIDSTFELPYLVQGMALDKEDSSLWITTSQGLFHLDDDLETYRLRLAPTLPQSSFTGILQAEDGAFWISSLRGLLRYNPSGTYWQYDLADGLSSLQFLFWSYAKDRSGRYLFGSTNGITVVHPEKIQPLNTEARPTLSELWINDTLQTRPLYLDNTFISFNEASEITLPFHRNTLSFRFAAREYSNPSSNRFRFQLVGVDDSLVNLGTESFVRYPNLPPNTYFLRLEATNSDGKWSPNAYTLKIVITPPWYQTWWFRLLMLSMVLFAIYKIIKNRIERIKKEALYKQKEAEYKQQVAEVEAAVLKLQMNPHFIFNSLGSVQNYLTRKHTESAELMLNKFIPLIRRILDYSVEEYITLSDEIDLLRRYVGIETMRFQGEVAFEVEVAPSIDPEETLIPPMILQPFVENSLKHGISTQQDRGGKIEVIFEEAEAYLLCRIRDNGRGRAQASQLTNQNKGHVSKATDITTRRIKLLEDKGYPDSRLEIIDLLDSSTQGVGTEVRLYLPLIQ